MGSRGNHLLAFLNSEPEREEVHDHTLLSQIAELIAGDTDELSWAEAKLVTDVTRRMSEAARLRIGLTWTAVRHGGRKREIVAPDLWMNARGQHLDQPMSERAARAYVALWVVLAQRYGKVMPRRGEHRWLMRVFDADAPALLRRCEVCSGFFLGVRESAIYCSARCRKRSFLAAHHRQTGNRRKSSGPSRQRAKARSGTRR